ncbi:MAG: sulfurtransferase complex subunit TusB [Pseudomonadota bacterium]|nr:sulfurtransferase complex subunit TusB [Pseudomonadota bacterium]
MLHTVNKSPFETHSLETCLGLAKPGSDILLIEDGVYAATAGTTMSAMVEQTIESSNVYALAPDLKARGIDPDQVIAGVQLVGYDGFVKLSVMNETVQCWL